MTVDHSEQAKAAYPDAEKGYIWTKDVQREREKERTAFDRGMAERRITDRETLAQTIWEAAEARSERTPYSWDYLIERAAVGAAPGDYPEIRDTVYAQADAILALPSTPITSSREALAEALWNAHHQGGIPWAKADEEERDYAFARADDLLASGLVKDNGEADPIPRYAQLDVFTALFGTDRANEFDGWRDDRTFADAWARLMGGVRERVSYAVMAEEARSATVDRLAVIREVMAYMDQVEAPRVAIKIGQHFGVAPVEEEA